MPTFLKKKEAATKSLPKFVMGGVWAAPKKPVAVRGRYGLPGAKDPLTNPRLPIHLSPARAGFPSVISSMTDADPSDDPTAWAKALKPQLDALLPTHGVVMVRGLGPVLHNASQFSRFMEAIKSEYDCRHFMEGRSMTSTQVLLRRCSIP